MKIVKMTLPLSSMEIPLYCIWIRLWSHISINLLQQSEKDVILRHLFRKLTWWIFSKENYGTFRTDVVSIIFFFSTGVFILGVFSISVLGRGALHVCPLLVCSRLKCSVLMCSVLMCSVLMCSVLVYLVYLLVSLLLVRCLTLNSFFWGGGLKWLLQKRRSEIC